MVYIAHSGVKGQKWGVRRYQNADGSLTAAGRARIRSMSPDARTYGIANRKLNKMNQKIDTRGATSKRLLKKEEYEKTLARTGTDLKASDKANATAAAYRSIKRKQIAATAYLAGTAALDIAAAASVGVVAIPVARLGGAALTGYFAAKNHYKQHINQGYAAGARIVDGENMTGPASNLENKTMKQLKTLNMIYYKNQFKNRE